MSRSMNDLAIMAVVGLSAAASLLKASVAAPTAPIAITLALIASSALGFLAVRAVFRASTHARALAGAWAASVVSYLVVEDLAAGFLRPGLTGRLLATGLVAALLAALVVSIRGNEARTETRGVSPA